MPSRRWMAALIAASLWQTVKSIRDREFKDWPRKIEELRGYVPRLLSVNFGLYINYNHEVI